MEGQVSRHRAEGPLSFFRRRTALVYLAILGVWLWVDAILLIWHDPLWMSLWLIPLAVLVCLTVRLLRQRLRGITDGRAGRE